MLRLFLILALAFPAGAPQDGLPTTVKEIRQLYANVQEAIANMNEEEHYRSQVVTTIQRTLPATGIRKETVTTFFSEYGEELEEEEGFNPDYRPYFITRKFSNEAGWKGYEEYLYDDESGRPIFVFIQIDYNDGKGKQEMRYYYGPMGLISENIKGERVMDDLAAQDQANLLWGSVKAQLNQFRDLAK
ncbi:MAG: hypothetical protein IKX34_00085 [Bacteroidales bacterium]|nr:hypothetical protein [Bacteroidales bacterium]